VVSCCRVCFFSPFGSREQQLTTPLVSWPRSRSKLVVKTREKRNILVIPEEGVLLVADLDGVTAELSGATLAPAQFGGNAIKVGDEEYTLFRDHEYVSFLPSVLGNPENRREKRNILVIPEEGVLLVADLDGVTAELSGATLGAERGPGPRRWPRSP
jgi:hypothetical protein